MKSLPSLDRFFESFLAGISIGLGAAIFCKLGGIIGAIMFTFGLLIVVHYKLPLYTGLAGFFNPYNKSERKDLLMVLIGNIIGTGFISMLFVDGIHEVACDIVVSRLDATWYQAIFRAIGCGMIMTLIVQAGRDKNIVPILFGVPLFILLGFYHCIADATYILLSRQISLDILIYYILIVIGNFIGCNIPTCLRLS